MVEEVEGKEVAAKLKNIPLSDDTLKRRVYEMDENVEKQLISRINDSDYFSIQMDESTDVTNKALLLMFVRYCVNDSSFEDLLFCKELPTTTIADEVMKCINSFFSLHSIDWKKCVGVCTDGAPNMSGIRCGVFAQIKKTSS